MSCKREVRRRAFYVEALAYLVALQEQFFEVSSDLHGVRVRLITLTHRLLDL